MSRQAALTSLAALEPATTADVPAHYIIHPSIIDRNKLLGGSSGGTNAVQLLTVLAGKPPRGFKAVAEAENKTSFMALSYRVDRRFNSKC